MSIIQPSLSTAAVKILYDGLVSLTRTIEQASPELLAHGILGGNFGYGAEFENDVFMMHPYCWCDQPDCLWCAIYVTDDQDATQRMRQEEQIRTKYGDPATAYPQAPNFWHKSTKFQVRWYKWIGRGMETNTVLVDWPVMFAECLASLSTKH